MSYFQIVVLALIQGMAELLPVSSTAHVIVAAKLMNQDPSSSHMTFLLIMLHTGTMFAVLFYFWPRWRPMLFPPAQPNGESAAQVSRFHFLKMVVLATAITGVLGYGLIMFIEKVILIKLMGHEKGEVEHLFKVLPLIAAAPRLADRCASGGDSEITRRASEVAIRAVEGTAILEWDILGLR